MTAPPLSRNPFADPAAPTCADLLARIAAASDLPARIRHDWSWALKTVARAAGKTPAQVPAHPEFMRKVLGRASPAAIKVEPASWNNARSLTRKVLSWAGLISIPGQYQAPFSPQWIALSDKLPAGKNAMRFQLARLFHYCSANDIAPAAIDDTVMAEFHAALVGESIVDNPYDLYRGAAKSWNNAIDRIAGWPPQRLTVPSRARTFSRPWSAFPPRLEAEVTAYLNRAAGLDLSDDHFTRPQRPATLCTRRWQLQMFATAIVTSGVPADALVGLAALLEAKTAERGLQLLLARNGGKSSVQISNIALFLPALARRIDLAPDTIAQLRKMAKKLKITQHGMTERNREALRAFDDESAVRALLTLPQRILDVVRERSRMGHREAKLVQTALAIELLLHAPVRIANLSSIRTDRHLIEVKGARARSLHLWFPAGEVKNATDLEFPLGPDTIELLDVYLSTWRPILADPGSTFLFPGKRPDRHKGEGALSGQIKELVHAYTRLDMPAHRFRHVVGKIYLDRHPGQYELVRRLLGHKSIQTTISFYAGAETAQAVRHYNKMIGDIRRRLDGGARHAG